MSSFIELKKSDKTILQEIFDKGLRHGHSCLNGMCGACRCKNPIEGRFQYIVKPIAIINEREDFLPCVSVVESDYIRLEVENGRVKKS